MEQNRMKAVICPRYGAPEILQLTTLPEPVPRANELLIRVVASTVNSGDVRVRGLQVQGWLRWVMRLVLGFSGPRQSVLGSVYSGIVCTVGDEVEGFQPGDEVFGMTGLRLGTHAEFITVKASSAVAKKPWNASHEQAAAIVFGGATALHFLKKAKIDREFGKHVLIYGATGSVGSSAVQLARIFGAQVTAVCSGAGMELAYALGAHNVLDYTQQDFTKMNKQYDLIFDAVGKINQSDCRHCLTPAGRFLSVNSLEMASETKEQLYFLRECFEKNQLSAVIDRQYQLEEIVEAHRYVDSGRKKGNVVLRLDVHGERGVERGEW
jgi:NADPH:quinone reductase-like Zn-dependent oxidoreductase